MAENSVLETVLLLALPASGKSEVRRYLEHVPPDKRERDFHMGPNAQLDDFPYVHIMRRVDDELTARGKARVYFSSSDKPFKDPLDWGTLIELLNEDYANLVGRKRVSPKSPALHIFDRIDAASRAVGAPERLKALDAATRGEVAKALDKECGELLKDLRDRAPESLKGKTLVIEFARGGPQGSAMPLKAPFGYEYSLSRLSEDMLRKAVILYIWVTPEESRRKNQARNNPDDPGSILHHGVPIDVMLNDYGCDDFEWLESKSERPGTVTVKAHGKTFHIPFARFDNRVDKTSFLRADPKAWDPAHVQAVHDGLAGALGKLAGARETAGK